MTTQQRDTILAALRTYQAVILNEPMMRGPVDADWKVEIQDIATNGGTHAGLSAAEIDELCEDINR